MRRALLFLGMTCCFVLQLLATHNRAGEITYRKLAGNTLKYEITITTYCFKDSHIDRDSLELQIYYCPEGSQPLDVINVKRTSKTLIYNDVYINVYVLESYTFPGQGCYRMGMLDPTRTGDIINIFQPDAVSFYIEDTLQVFDPQFYGFNSSPVLLNHPVVFAGQYQTFTHNPGAYDPDGDSLDFSLIPPLEDQGLQVPGYRYPNDPNFVTDPALPNELWIDHHTGEITWNVPQQTGKYNVAILIREFREGKFVGSMIRDMQIWVLEETNRPPQVSAVKDTCVVAGESLRAVLQADDPDNDVITAFTAVGGPFAVDNSPATWLTNAPVNAPANGEFEWQTNCSHVRSGSYMVVFTATDDFESGNKQQPYSDAETWLIQVAGPPPQNPETEVDQAGQRIKVMWDSLYACDQPEYDNFTGFTVWRKPGCDASVLGECEYGNLEQHGYTRISGEEPIDEYHYSDDDAVAGVVYSYRVQAEFAEPIPGSQFSYNQVAGLPSAATCAQLKSDLPVITHADVRETDAGNGSVMVKWYPPNEEALDTINNPGPYKYELYSHEGLTATGNATLLNTYHASQFYQLQPDSFLHSAINTRDQAHTYTIKFYASDQDTGTYEVGETSGASTVFLQSGSADQEIHLTWEESVPWANHEYQVYRKHVDSSGYDLLATAADRQYVDTDVENKLEYCYYVRAFGSYSNGDYPDPLINNSQEVCAIPRDTTAPCPPMLTVSDNCSNLEPVKRGAFENQLSWSDPRENCDDQNLAGYFVYYATGPDANMQLLTSIDEPEESYFTHDELNSPAGCYAVTAVDSFGNESLRSNKVCLDNCPVYKLPNAFTPNGDGQNDQFTPVKPYYFIDRIDISIYNRWGNLIYKTTNPDINWDGTDQQSGKPVPEGVYHYFCEVYGEQVNGVESKLEPLSGYIQLVRGK